MNTITLNIGLNTNDGGKVALHDAFATVNKLFTVRESAIFPAPDFGERVLVLELDHEAILERRLHELCHYLFQDCIAIWDGVHGGLVGPKAEKWGAFNPDFFVQIDGSRLSGEAKGAGEFRFDGWNGDYACFTKPTHAIAIHKSEISKANF